MELRRILIYSAVLVLVLAAIGCECRSKKAKKEKQIQSRETSLFNFLRLLFLRVVYGIATSLGFGEGISNFMGGIFVPPGVNDDYDDYGFDGGDDY
ncbi:uncharacterized protein [Anabrus simplex]|uniref:uncharacterized protein n=1 Tax=Anabrus simplex TaxID=316456 RepID=UPI0034DD6F3D